MAIPLRTALIGEKSGAEIAAERLILLEDAEQSVEFDNIGEAALLSVNRGFSAPVVMDVERGDGDLETLAASDSDPFARYAAIQELLMRWLAPAANGEIVDPGSVIRAIGDQLRSNRLEATITHVKRWGTGA